MAVTSSRSSDNTLNRYLDILRGAEFGRDARTPMRGGIDRCYEIAVNRAGSPRNGVTRDVINAHLNRISSAVFGEDVRDATATALELCYSARGISLNSTERGYFTTIRECQLAEELKNAIIHAMVQCCKDVKT